MKLPWMNCRFSSSAFAPNSPDLYGILTNRRSHFVQCIAVGRRFCVEWRESYYFRRFEHFDHWRAQDQKRRQALNVPYTRDGIPQDKDPDLLTYSDTCVFSRLFCAASRVRRNTIG